MTVVYVDVFFLINFLVDFLLFLGTDRLSGCPARPGAACRGALIGACYGAACLVWPNRFLRGGFGQLGCLVLMVGAVFGFQKSSFRKTAIFLLLSMSLGGIATVSGRGGFSELLLALTCILGIFLLTLGGKLKSQDLVPVELQYEGRHLRVMAMRDTGNVLTDPVTGEGVLILGADVGEKMLGLTEKELRDPVSAMLRKRVPGLRLIPYRAVGISNGMLLGVPLDSVTIDSHPAGRLVAFAPEPFEGGRGYQALTGGMV